MLPEFPIGFSLHDGTHVMVYKENDQCYEFFLTRLNSEKHNFFLVDGRIEESYETRFDHLQEEAVRLFNEKLQQEKAQDQRPL